MLLISLGARAPSCEREREREESMKSSGSSSGGHGQAPIPAAAKKVVQSLKEIVKKHSDEEIYAALKDCDMDPNLAVHVLMNQDTFHEVKRKRDKRREQESFIDELEPQAARPRASRVMADELHDEEALMHSSESSKPGISIDPSCSRFPHCIVWTPLPIVSWLAPFVGHVGVCCEDGIILDFAGSYLVNVDNLAFGPTARYAQLDGQQCCFPPHLYGHTCESRFEHAELGTATSWDDGLRSCMQTFQHKCFNLFTCNCHCFVASFLNRIAYQKSIKWNMIDIVSLVLLRGQWVSKWSVARSLVPFTTVMCLGLLVAGWPFFAAWAVFDFLLIAWFLFGTYIRRELIES